MRDDEVSTLFNALGQVLYNQDKILKHLGINKCDSGYGYDHSIENVANECCSVAREHVGDY